MLKTFSLIVLICLSLCASAQETGRVYGSVTDLSSSEPLVGASISLLDSALTGASTDLDGYYTLEISRFPASLLVSYIGYQSDTVSVMVPGRMDLALSAGIRISDIVIDAATFGGRVEDARMGAITLDPKDIRLMPALFGEVDVLKSLQLLPGVQSAGEGSSGYYVRGGAPDQNLVLLDGATVYNPGHLLGFFSVFNPDILGNVTLYKGSVPAHYGGRLSSTLLVETSSSENDWEVNGGIGLVSSRVQVSGPLGRKTGVTLSGRRTYLLDLAQPLIKNTDFAGTNYFFHDYSLRIDHELTERDHLYFSSYLGRDRFSFNNVDNGIQFDLPYGNTIGSIHWDRQISDRWKSSLLVSYSDYRFEVSGAQEGFEFLLESGVRDLSAAYRLLHLSPGGGTLGIGAEYHHFRLQPNILSAEIEGEAFTPKLATKYGQQMAITSQYDRDLTERWRMGAGLRLQSYQNVGPVEADGSGLRRPLEVIKSYYYADPTLSLRYQVDEHTSLKAETSITHQSLHLVSQSTSTIPSDLWVGSSERIRPQRAEQISVGYFGESQTAAYEWSVELYYKRLHHQLDYRDDFVDNFAEDIENQFVAGQGRAHGAEFYFRKNKGQFTGWLSYTYSRALRSFDEIEDGREFPTVYDRPHDLSIVGIYELSDRWSVSGTFIYTSGRRYTPIQSVYFIEQNLVSRYGPRNSARLPDYHRLDIAATYTRHPSSTKRWQSSWTFGVYNVYVRKNTFFTFTDLDVDADSGIASASAQNFALFPFVPSVTWNFTWN